MKDSEAHYHRRLSKSFLNLISLDDDLDEIEDLSEDYYGTERFSVDGRTTRRYQQEEANHKNYKSHPRRPPRNIQED